ncbi:MAG: GTP pyrophosphokinase [Ardenticatenaceae bacterium]|nr:GTP pyrophosphokinase [Ardenticatenaceae bacterium]
MQLVEKAIALAVAAHAGEVDKEGKPYILHPLRLMVQMETAEEMMTAVLHDVVEDTPITLDDLRQQGFPAVVLEALALLTHDTASTSYEDYVAAIKPNALARKVKLADLAHNMDVRRLPELGMKDYGRLEKYRRAWGVLKE